MKSLRQIYNPALFQGSLKNKNYFEGWYFKHVSADGTNACAVIPGISLSDDPHSFIQYIDGNTGKTHYYRYAVDEFSFSRSRFELTVGRSFFSDSMIILDLEDGDHNIAGRVDYSGVNRFPKRLLSPGIMGWYSFVPGMECNHGVVSTGHSLKGSITSGGQNTDYSNGKGYIEKDWGISFPQTWIWLQCNSFGNEDASVMISVARIPWGKSWFTGFLSFFRSGDKTQILATYNGAKVRSLRRIDEVTTEVILVKGDMTLTALVTKKGSGTLRAPSMGLMNSMIKESLNSEVLLEIKSGNSTLFSGRGTRAGWEETEQLPHTDSRFKI